MLDEKCLNTNIDGYIFGKNVNRNHNYQFILVLLNLRTREIVRKRVVKIGKENGFSSVRIDFIFENGCQILPLEVKQ